MDHADDRIPFTFQEATTIFRDEVVNGECNNNESDLGANKKENKNLMISFEFATNFHSQLFFKKFVHYFTKN